MSAAGSIRRLHPADIPIFRRIRLAALRQHPEAFSSSYEEEAAQSLEVQAQRLLSPPGCMFGAFVDQDLFGITGLLRQTRLKTQHKATLISVYLDAAHRRSGLGRRLVETAIAHARDSSVRVLHLSVTVGNQAARRLYAELGFRGYGIEHRALWVDGVFFDDEHMVLDLD